MHKKVKLWEYLFDFNIKDLLKINKEMNDIYLYKKFRLKKCILINQLKRSFIQMRRA